MSISNAIAYPHGMIERRSLYAAVIATVIVLVVLYRETVASMVDQWTQSSSYQHGFAVVPIVIWLIWNRRLALARVPLEPSLFGLIAMAAAGALWLLGVLAPASVVAHFAIVSMIIAAVPAILGLRMTYTLVFPLAFLFFAVPFGDFMVPTLMDWTADFVVTALRASGIPVFREGNDFVIPSGRWSVVEACSGIRYFHAALMGGALFAILVYRSPTRRLAFIAFSIVAPIIANWLRAYLIVLVGHLSSNRLATGVDHLVYGWLFFGVVMFGIFWVGARWREDRQDAVPTADAPVRDESGLALSRSRFGWVTVALLLIALVWMPLSLGIQARLDAFVPVMSEKAIRAADWRAVDAADSVWKPTWPGARTESRALFTRSEARAGVHIAWFYGEKDGLKSKLVSSQNTLANQKSGWRVIDRGEAAIPWRGATRATKRTVLSNGVEQIEVYSFYWIAGFTTSQDLLASAVLALSRVIYARNDAAMVVIYAHVGPNGASPLGSFAVDVSESVEAALNHARREQSAAN
ncbi:MAG: exosortase A [Burkholderiales bacterium]